jgi:hypothetical protein
VQEHNWLPPVPHGDTIGQSVRRVSVCAFSGFPTFFTSEKFSVVLPLSIPVDNRVYLSHGVQVIGAAWWVVTRIVVGVGDLVPRAEDGQLQVRYSVAGRSRGRVILCVVYTIHKETRSASFLV